MKKKQRLWIFILCTVFLLTGCQKITYKEPKLPSLRIGYVSYKPFIYQDENGQLAGADVELATQICKEIGRSPEFVEIEWGQREDLLEQGQIDCLWGGLAIDDREGDYQWTDYYLAIDNVIVVPKQENAYTLEDLVDRRIAARSGSKALRGILGENSLKKPIGSTQYCMVDFKHVMIALKSGYVDAAVGMECSVKAYLAGDLKDYLLLKDKLNSVHIGVAFEKSGDQKLIDQMNQAFEKARKEGFLDEICERYHIVEGGE